jgi:hypothetical protein
MSSKSKESTSRRAFFQDVTAGTAGIAVASALAQLGAPTVVAAQESKTPEPKKATAAKFFKNPPPWPKGTTGNKYSHLFCTQIKENSLIPDVVPGPQAYFRGESVLPGAGMNMGWQLITKPYTMEHNPLDFKRVTKPILWSALHLAPYFNAVYQTMGYMDFRGAPGGKRKPKE